MDKKREFDVCLELLRQVVAARGGNTSQLDSEYAWPGGDGTGRPGSAVSLAPLLTGSNHEAPPDPPPTPGAPPPKP